MLKRNWTHLENYIKYKYNRSGKNSYDKRINTFTANIARGRTSQYELNDRFAKDQNILLAIRCQENHIKKTWYVWKMWRFIEY